MYFLKQKSLQDVRDYFFIYDDRLLEAEYDTFMSALRDPATKEYTGRQFNMWYCAVCQHLLKMNESEREDEIRRMKEKTKQIN